MRNVKKTIALVLVVLSLMMMFLSQDALIRNAHHHCTGEDCTVCMIVDTAARLLSTMHLVCAWLFAVFVFCVFARFYTAFKKHICVRNTLVLLNVELLN